MTERSFDEMIAYFNRRVSEIDIAQDYKMELLGWHKKRPDWCPLVMRQKDGKNEGIYGI